MNTNSYGNDPAFVFNDASSFSVSTFSTMSTEGIQNKAAQKLYHNVQLNPREAWYEQNFEGLWP